MLTSIQLIKLVQQRTKQPYPEGVQKQLFSQMDWQNLADCDLSHAYISSKGIYSVLLFLMFMKLQIVLQMQFLLDVAMAICPVTGYVLQYRLIRKNQSVGGFSIDVCLVLLVANILRLNFYPFQHFETALIFQSLFMIIAQLVLLYACSNYKDDPSTAESGTEVSVQNFWRWSSYTPYWQSTLLFSFATAFVSLIMWLLGIQIYGETIGLIALLTESLLILPQIIEIFKSGRVYGISYSLIILNLLGDAFKTFYFFYNDQPFQFKLCGIIQLILDVFVISQMAYVRVKVTINEIQAEELQTQGSNKQKEIQQKKDSISDELEGSLSRSVVLEEQVANLDNFQIKDEAETESNLE